MANKRKMMKQAMLAIVTGGASLAAGGAAAAAEAGSAASSAAGAAQGAAAGSAPTAAATAAPVAPAAGAPAIPGADAVAPAVEPATNYQSFMQDKLSLENVFKRFKDQQSWDSNPLNNIANRLTGGLYGAFNRPGALNGMDLYGMADSELDDSQRNSMMMSNLILQGIQSKPPSMMSAIGSLINPMNYTSGGM